MKDTNNIVMIDLDRPREIYFGHKALKMMMSTLGKNLEEFNIDGGNLEEVEKIMYFGLLRDAKDHNEDLKMEDMEDLLDQASSFGEIVQKLTLAVNKAFDQASSDQKNLQRVATKKKTS